MTGPLIRAKALLIRLKAPLVRAKAPRHRLRRLFTWRKALAGVLVLCALPTGAFVTLYLVIDVPRANEQAKAQSNLYLYSDGSVLARTGEINRETVPIGRVPEDVRHAFVAAENKSFYEDAGVDSTGLVRGLFNTLAGKGTQGGSTITQQYVKNYYLSQEQTLTRKVKELIISLKVDRRNAKDDILAGYLNTSYFGRVAYGIQAAARAYYDKDVEDLTVEEGAYLAALLQAPSQYDWAVASPGAKKLVQRRWSYVLDNMVGMGWLDPGERRGMRFPAPVAPEPAPGLGGQAGYLVDVARGELLASGVSEQELAAGGWTITLNVSPEKQRSLKRSVERQSERDRSAGARRADADTQTGAVSVDPRNGRILALYGGRDYTEHYLNNATRNDYQAGPAFEPVRIAADMEYAVPGGARREKGGPRHVLRTAEALGMDPDASGFDADPKTLALGLMGTSPLDMAGVYATLGHDGRKVTPAIVRSARRGGERAGAPDPVGERVVGSKTASMISSLLTGAPGQSGAPGPALGVKQFVTGKSGTSDDKKASWFIGGTPELVTAVGVFGESAEDGEQTGLKNAARERPSAIWSAYTEEALRDAYPAGAVPEAKPPVR